MQHKQKKKIDYQREINAEYRKKIVPLVLPKLIQAIR